MRPLASSLGASALCNAGKGSRLSFFLAELDSFEGAPFFTDDLIDELGVGFALYADMGLALTDAAFTTNASTRGFDDCDFGGVGRPLSSGWSSLLRARDISIPCVSATSITLDCPNERAEPRFSFVSPFVFFEFSLSSSRSLIAYRDFVLLSKVWASS